MAAGASRTQHSLSLPAGALPELGSAGLLCLHRDTDLLPLTPWNVCLWACPAPGGSAIVYRAAQAPGHKFQAGRNRSDRGWGQRSKGTCLFPRTKAKRIKFLSFYFKKDKNCY